MELALTCWLTASSRRDLALGDRFSQAWKPGQDTPRRIAMPPARSSGASQASTADICVQSATIPAVLASRSLNSKADGGIISANCVGIEKHSMNELESYWFERRNFLNVVVTRTRPCKARKLIFERAYF